MAMPGTQKARTITSSMAGKAAKAARGSTKGASKMASALGKKFRMSSSSGHQALSDENPGDLQAIIGREELDADDAEDVECQSSTSKDRCVEDTSSLLFHAQCSPQSTPSTDRPRSPECVDRSDYSSHRSESSPRSDTHTQGETGSDSDAAGRSKGRAQASAQRAEPETWDAKAFANSTRPLECGSIWDIPTSRVPKPAPPPVRTPRGRGRDPGGSKSLPKISVKLEGGSPARLHERQSGRMQAAVCLSLSLCAAAVVGAMYVLYG